ncbi:acetolactate synthase large subunit [Gammaproteobacteria bacterium]|nr:acetolactate synthase large subunit [Gammaproteobacteria bacterium]
MKTSDLFIKCLENEGIEYIFGVPGEENADFLMSLQDSKKIKFILTRHEQGAAFMAESYGKLTGKLSCCLSTLGPGATNLLTGVADANMDHSPVLVITGQGSSDRLHKESHQIMDVCNMFKSVTKWTTSIRSPNTIPEIVRKAVRLATLEKPGAVHIELPEDIAKLDVETMPLKSFPYRRSIAEDAVIYKAYKLMCEANSPILIAGNGAIRKRSSRQLREFCERTNIPVVTTFMGKGAVDCNSDYCLSTVGLGAIDFGDIAIKNSDLVITLGYDMVEYHPKLWSRNSEAKIIHIDFEAAEIDEHYIPEVEVVGDLAHSLSVLNNIIDKEGIKSYDFKYVKKMRADLKEDHEYYKNDEQKGLIKPQKFLYDLRKFLNKDDILISDVGAHKMWIARNYPCYEPNTCIVPNGFCSMGYALPAVIAASLTNTNHRIFSICGDAGFLMNLQEMETAKRLNSNFVVIIWEDKSYGLIKWKQQAQFGRSTELDFDNPDWEKLAKSFDWNYLYEDDSSKIFNKLQETNSLQGPTLFVIPIDYSENEKLTKFLGTLEKSYDI